MDTVEEAAQQVKDLASRVSKPERMSKKEYREFLDDLISHFEIERDAAGEDEDDG